MISFLTGRVAGRTATFALIDVGGVGFRLFMSTRSLSVLPSDGDEVTVHSYLHVREGEMTLFGFESTSERDAFEALLTVNGVGPKVALATLSTLSVDDLAAAIATEDVALVSSVPGVGKKTAQRIIIDLADTLGLPGGVQSTSGSTHSGSHAHEAREALLAMGFSAPEIAAALKSAPQGSSTEELLKHGLVRLGGGA